MTYTRNKEKIPFTVDGNINRLIAFEYPMYSEYERLSIATKQSLDINGRGQSFQIPFSKDVYAIVFSTQKRTNSDFFLCKTFFLFLTLIYPGQVVACANYAVELSLMLACTQQWLPPIFRRPSYIYMTESR